MQTFIEHHEPIADISSAGNVLAQSSIPDQFQLRDRDICCGRGKGCWNHPGNQMFQTIIHASAEKYSEATTKNDKSLVVASIVDGLAKSGARFVKEDKQSGRWYDIGQTQAREKTGHAIRDYILNRSKREARAQQRLKKQASKGKGKSQTAKHKNATVSPVKQRTETPTPRVCRSHERHPEFDRPTKEQPFGAMSVPPIPLTPRFSQGQQQQGLGIFEVVDLLVNQSGHGMSVNRPISSQDLSAQEVLEVYELLSEEEADMAFENGSDDIDADLPFSDDWW